MYQQPVVIYHRLIALWAICEAFGGGLLHAFKIPFTGLFVNSLAVLCITLIGYHYRKPGAIIKATLIVCVFKLMLSPHSPPTAYIAVIFQGFLGQILFTGKGNFTARAITLAVLSLVESSIQRLLVLIIVYGSSFWQAVDEYLSRLFDGGSNYVETLAVLYISFHALTGFFAGYFASRLARIHLDSKFILPLYAGTDIIPQPGKRKKRVKYLFMVVWAVLLFIYIDSFLNPQSSVLSAHKSVMILVRASVIILTWWLLLSPMLKRILTRFIKKHESLNTELVYSVNMLLPEVLYIFSESWKASAQVSTFRRPLILMKFVITNILHPQIKAK